MEMESESHEKDLTDNLLLQPETTKKFGGILCQ